MQLRIVALTDAHAVAVQRIQQECYGTAHIETLGSLSAKWRAAPGTCFVAERDGATVAYLVTVPVRFPRLPAWNAPAFALATDADTLYLHDLAVSRAARGSGAGNALVRAALAAGHAAGYTQACLVAVQGSVPYWQALDFAEIAPPDDSVAAKLASFGDQARLMRAVIRANAAPPSAAPPAPA